MYCENKIKTTSNNHRQYTVNLGQYKNKNYYNRNNHASKHKYTVPQNKLKKNLKPGLVASYDYQPLNRAWLFSNEKISEETDKWRKHKQEKKVRKENELKRKRSTRH